MIQVFSQIQKDKLLYSLLKENNISEYRSDICPDNEYLQISARLLKSGTKVKAHKHLPIHRESDITQEAWVILEGKVKATIFDLDDSICDEVILEDGDCLVLFRGGHSLEVLDKNTIMYEFKTGPYFGFEKDKETINE